MKLTVSGYVKKIIGSGCKISYQLHMRSPFGSSKLKVDTQLLDDDLDSSLLVAHDKHKLLEQYDHNNFQSWLRHLDNNKSTAPTWEVDIEKTKSGFVLKHITQTQNEVPITTTNTSSVEKLSALWKDRSR